MNNRYTPTVEEEYMNPSQLQYFKIKLLAMQQEYANMSIIKLNEINNTKREVSDEPYNDSYMEINIVNEDYNSYMKKEIQDAIDRIDDLTYGYCEDTGEEIGIKRLLAKPTARYSIRAQEKREQNISSKVNNYYNE